MLNSFDAAMDHWFRRLLSAKTVEEERQAERKLRELLSVAEKEMGK